MIYNGVTNENIISAKFYHLIHLWNSNSAALLPLGRTGLVADLDDAPISASHRYRLAKVSAAPEVLFILTLSAHRILPVQPSELEILREVEALKDIRRRSSAQGGPGAIPLDPDLPELPPSPSSPHSSPAWSASLSSDEREADVPDDPSHLFWVPARLHPELAPGEFRAFLKEHARDGGVGLQRTDSASSSSSTLSLGRKKSMLSRQYRPSESDGVENEHVVPIRRSKSSLYSNPSPQLTIGDLQKLEELAEEASMSDDPSKLRSMLRRSLSLTTSPSCMLAIYLRCRFFC